MYWCEWSGSCDGAQRGPMSNSTDRQRLAKLVDEIASFIRHYEPALVVRVGVDGVDGVGKTVFADMVARAVEAQGRGVIRVSVDGFHNPRKDRYRWGRASPEGFYLDSYDYAGLKRVLLDPLGPRARARIAQRYSIISQTHHCQCACSWPIRLPSSSSMGSSFTARNLGMSGTYPFSWMRHLT